LGEQFSQAAKNWRHRQGNQLSFQGRAMAYFCPAHDHARQRSNTPSAIFFCDYPELRKPSIAEQRSGRNVSSVQSSAHENPIRGRYAGHRP
jgi:hypothetical protein